MGDRPVAPPEVRRIASAGLPDGPRSIRIAADRWPTVLSGLRFCRLTGFAVGAWKDGTLELTELQRDELLEHHRSAMLLALAIEQRLLRLQISLQAAQVRAVVLKGPAMAHAAYPEPSLRSFGDLDLLVSATQWRRACQVLRTSGYERDLPEPRPRFDERFGKSATHTDEQGYQVDLHRTLVLGAFGLWLDPEELLGHTGTFTLAGRNVERLDTTGMLLNAALHASLGSSPPLLVPLRDVAQLAHDPGVDWGRLAAWSARWHLAAPLAFAFRSASEHLEVGLPAAARAMAEIVSPNAERRALAAYTERRRTGGLALTATRAIPGVRAKAAYTFGMLVPSREFLRARAGRGSKPTYRARWSVPMRWVGRRPRNHGTENLMSAHSIDHGTSE
ncbi:MAG TPA: nucleotidyltransferase family protein [Actinomycetota bacterium]|jgi:hypothetical protein